MPSQFTTQPNSPPSIAQVNSLVAGFGIEGIVFLLTALTVTVKLTSHINNSTSDIQRDIALMDNRLQSVEDKLTNLTTPPEYGPRPHSARKWQRPD